MKKILGLIFLFFFMILFSGCSSIIGGKAPTSSNNVDVDITGNGLELKFETSTKWIYNRRIDYEISFKNSGLEPITLNKNNVILESISRINGNQIPLTQQSIENFYNQLFKEGDIILGHDQEIPIIKGFFEVDEMFFKLNQNLDLSLKVSYDYKTLFSNNVEIDLKNLKLTNLDAVSQAAPVKITKIELKPGNDLSKYEVGYYIEDRGSSSFSDERIVKISSFEIKFGTDTLNSNCKFFKKDKDSNFVETQNLELNNPNKVLIVACPKDFSTYNQDKFITTTSGSFNYNYVVKKTNLIQFPDKKSVSYNW